MLLQIAVLLLICSFGAVSAQTIDSVSALRLVSEYTGLNRTLGDSAFIVPSSVELSSKALKDELPFAEKIQIGAYWKVTFEGVQLWSEGPCAQQAEFDLFLDKSDGALLYAVRKPYNDRDSLFPGPTEIAADIPRVIRCILYEFIGFVAHPPEIPLTGALAKATFSRPCGARSVIAYLLKLRNREKEEFVAWVVVGVEAPAIGLSGPDSPAIETWVTIVNAETGKAVTAAQISAHESKE